MVTLEQAQKVQISRAIEKGYKKDPTKHSFKFLIHRLRQELNEFENELYWNRQPPSFVKSTYELADVMNILSFITNKWKKEILGEKI